MPLPEPLLRRLRAPWAAPVVLALVTVAVRLGVVLQGLANNPQVMRPTLDARVFLRWAGEIAGGDVLGRSGVAGGEPWFFNPLPAYLLAPFVRSFDTATALVTAGVEPLLQTILIAQVLLGAGTTALATLAADRLFGRRAAWIAGAGVAFSQVLAQLDAHVSAAELSAFLVAGACFATTRARAPQDEASGDESAQKPVGIAAPLLAGLWLGVGALARPITPIALPFIALLFWLRSGRSKLAPALVLLAFGACAVPSLARNWAISGEAHVYTASSGANMWLGNSPIARQSRSMLADEFRFDPRNMHAEARATMMLEKELTETPSWGAVSTFYRDRTLAELGKHPGALVGFLFQKARWFATPSEIPSSGALVLDREFAPIMWIAFVPSWLLAVLGLSALVVFRKRPEVLLGPGALVIAHWAVLTLVFPLSHYRAPAIPALAILAGGLIDAGITAWRSGAPGRVGGTAVVAVLAGLAWLPPAPNSLLPNAELNMAHAYLDLHEEAMDNQDIAAGERTLERALEFTNRAERRFATEWPGRGWAAAPSLRAKVYSYGGRIGQACEEMERALQIQPNAWYDRVTLSCWLESLGESRRALEQAERAYQSSGGAPEAAMRLAEMVGLVRGRPAAEQLFKEALRAGLTPQIGRCGGR